MDDQPGKDPQIGQEVVHDLRKHYDDVLPSGKILISVIDKALVEHHVVVPIPKSYEAAMAITFDTLAEHIHTTGTVAPNDMYLKYRMRETGGDLVWAKIIPELWSGIVRDGDHLRLFSRAIESQPEFGSCLASLHSSAYSYSSSNSAVLVLLPKTYEATKRLAMATFGIDRSVDDVALFIRCKFGGDEINRDDWQMIGRLMGAEWDGFVKAVRNQFPKVEIRAT